VPERLEERERHSPADEHLVGAGCEGTQNADLVLHLGATDDHDKWLAGSSSKPVSTSTSRASKRPAAEGR